MARKLAFISALIGLCLASSAYALGLGSIESRSSLNQPLSARVPLIGVDADEASAVSVSLASEQAFKRAGVERPFFLSRLHFDVKTGSNGTYIEVTTKDAIKEPFLDFLVEVSWPKGRLVREYTVLLNPPTYAPDEQAPATQAPAVAAGNAAPADAGKAGSASPTAGGARASGAPQRGQVSEMQGGARATRYGPVKRDETLWEIAQSVRHDRSVSVNQTMLAILRANPDAFINGNMNRLKRGSILRVPAADDMGAIPVAEANAEVRRQIAQWQRSRGVAGGSGEVAQSGEAESGEAESGEAQQAAAGGEQQKGGKLTVVAPEKGTGEEPATSAQGEGEAGQNVEHQMTLLKESNASLKAENEDLKAQVEALKKEVASMESDVNVETGQALPGGPEQTAEADQADQAEEQPAKQTEPGNGGEEAKTEAQSAEQKAQGEQKQAEEKPAAEDRAAAGNEPEKAESPEQATETAVQPKPASEPEPKPTAKAQPKPAPVTPFWQDPMVMGLLGAVALVLLLLVYLVMRRRGGGDDVQDLSDQIAQAQTVDDDIGEEPEAPAGGAAGGGGLAESADEAMETELPPESDVLSEADVYLAYGRYDQAQEAVDKALQHDPANKELRLKMLEILALTQDRAAFEDQAQQLHELVEDDSDPAWRRACEMGREIAPEHPLFGDEGSANQGSPAAAGGVSETDFELPEADQPAAGETAETLDTAVDQPAQAAESSVTDDFSDLDFSFEDEEQPASKAGEPNGDDMSLDFDLDDVSGGDEATAATDEPDRDPGARETSVLEGLDFDEEPSQESSADSGSGGAEDEVALDLDFNLDEETGEETDPPASVGEDSEATDAYALDESDSGSLEDFDFGFEEPAGSGSTDGEDDSQATTKDVEMQSTAAQPEADYPLDADTEAGGGYDDDADMLDEVGTKLDLARAYMDMGDNDGARSLLDEVVEEGDAAQIQEARELLDKVG